MPLEHILQAIEAEAQAEIDRITAEAEAQAGEILAKAEAEAAAIRQRHLGAVAPLVHTERARLLNEARLAALREVMQVREELIADAFALAEKQLAEVRRQPEYSHLLCRLAEEAIAELGPEGVRHGAFARQEQASTAVDSGRANARGGPQTPTEVILRVDPRDVTLVEAFLPDLAVPATVEPVLNCIGGLEVCTVDRRIVVSNTFETRLGQARQRLRREVADLVAGGFAVPAGRREAEQWLASTSMAMPA